MSKNTLPSQLEVQKFLTESCGRSGIFEEGKSIYVLVYANLYHTPEQMIEIRDMVRQNSGPSLPTTNFDLHQNGNAYVIVATTEYSANEIAKYIESADYDGQEFNGTVVGMRTENDDEYEKDRKEMIKKQISSIKDIGDLPDDFNILPYGESDVNDNYKAEIVLNLHGQATCNESTTVFSVGEGAFLVVSPRSSDSGSLLQIPKKLGSFVSSLFQTDNNNPYLEWIQKSVPYG